jgi:hypothetical protein
LKGWGTAKPNCRPAFTGLGLTASGLGASLLATITIYFLRADDLSYKCLPVLGWVRAPQLTADKLTENLATQFFLPVPGLTVRVQGILLRTVNRVRKHWTN